MKASVTDADCFSDLMAYFSDTTKEKYFINLKIVEELYGAENPLLKYVGLQLWDEYSRILKADKEKDEDYPVRQRLEDLTLPFRYSLINKILDWQKNKPYNPLLDMPPEYYKCPTLTLVIPRMKGTTEYIASDFALFPLIVYYLRTIYEHKKYFSYCKVCGKLFLAPDNNKTFICSDKCKAKQQKTNKKKYDDAHKGDSAEKLHKDEYQYWFNRLAKARRKKHTEAIAEIEEAFYMFKVRSLCRKNRVQEGLFPYGKYKEWCIEERNSIDKIMIKFDLFDRG